MKKQVWIAVKLTQTTAQRMVGTHSTTPSQPSYDDAEQVAKTKWGKDYTIVPIEIELPRKPFNNF